MGQVFLAWHEHLQRKCALKLLLPQATRDPDFLQRFLQEGRAAASLVHPNIVTTHAIGGEKGVYFLEMEFVAGRSLQRLLAEDGRLEPLRATALCARIAEGLSAAHRDGIVHRDLKLDNVLLTHQGIPKIGDFGLAKRVMGSEGRLPDLLAGTPNYMAPELFSGNPATPASDVYALGVCYFLLLTGRFPYSGTSLAELIEAVTHAPLPRIRDELPGIPLEMAECLSLLLSKAPSNRPRDGTEAAQLLEAVCGQVRDLNSLLQEAFEGRPDVVWARHGEGYRVNLTFPDGRRQAAFLEPSRHAVSERLLLIYSICCDAQPAYFEQALRLNSEIPHGGLAVRDVDGRPKFVMLDTYPRATVDAEEVRRSVIEVAWRADFVEKLLTGLDVH
jgi:serine/threonine-protein kinase